MILLGGIPSPGQLIMLALTLAINLSFFLLLKLNQSNKKSVSKGGKNLPQLWDGFIWITPGYSNLGLKSPLCWKQFNHTKDNQSSNTRKLGYVPYRWCQYIISLEDKDSTEQTKSDDLRYTGLHLMEILNISLTCDFTNAAVYVTCISPVLQNCCFLHCQMCVWGL